MLVVEDVDAGGAPRHEFSPIRYGDANHETTNSSHGSHYLYSPPFHLLEDHPAFQTFG